MNEIKKLSKPQGSRIKNHLCTDTTKFISNLVQRERKHLEYLIQSGASDEEIMDSVDVIEGLESDGRES